MAIFFYSKCPEYSWLSNFSNSKFTLDDLKWSSVEHFYQAQKFLETETFEQIRRSATPLKARKAGQNRSLVPRPDWHQVKEEVMRRAIYAKFEQNKQLKLRLLATGEEELIHHSSRDLFWGCNKEGIGDNRLGKIIMEIRHSLRVHNAN
ncbi:MAG: NADAR family protein [Waterburya sp.]